MGNNTCIFTIVSNNYLHYANTLFDSAKEFCPGADLILGLCDKKIPETYCPDAEIIEILDLTIKNIGQFIYQYTILELNTAIKPYIIEVLMNRGYDKIIYLDPDIKIYGSFQNMLSLLDHYNVLLTPHLTDLLDDDKLPNELGILQAGSYNLGYIGLRANDETRKLVKWWQEKLYKECVVDISRGLFVDQKWMDLVPSLFEGVYINRDEGWNVAYWNLNHRDITEVKENRFEVNGKPLVFFHYSGYSIDAKTLSKHQNRFMKNTKGKALVRLCEIYNQSLLSNNIAKFKEIPYFFQTFVDGTNVPDAARKVIRDADFSEIDFFKETDVQRLYKILNQISPRAKYSKVPVTKLAEAIWNSRADLQIAFPDIYNSDSTRYIEWLISTGASECGLDDIFIEPILKSFSLFRTSQEYSYYKKELSLSTKVIKKLWGYRQFCPEIVRNIIGDPVLHWVRFKLNDKKQTIIPGINLIGYMQAESGVGEAARSSLRAIKKANLSYSVMDYRVGNVSRMMESVESKYSDELPYSINLIHANADQIRIARDYLGENLSINHYNIGYWYWELPEFPEAYDFAFDCVDEIWVSTYFNLAAISEKTNKPVRRICPNVNVSINPSMTRRELGLCKDDFIFFHMSDTLSIHERKNPLGVVEAFNLAFGSQPSAMVSLLLKISNLDKQPELEDKLQRLIADEPRIHLINGYLERNTLNNIMNNIDCYISLHRSEGFGLPISEAMYLSKPVIATYWSGNTDFMTESNSLPVKYKLVELDRDIGPYSKGQQWADPCIEDAADKMVAIANNPMLQCRMGKKARETIESNYSVASSAAQLNKRIAELLASL